MTRKESRQEVLRRIWEGDKERRETGERSRFNFPAIGGVELAESCGPLTAACFNWYDHKAYLSSQTVDDLAPHMKEEDSMRAMVRHEVGHWTFFPRELYKKIFLLAESSKQFGGKTEPIWAIYSDCINEHELLASGIGNDELLTLRKKISLIPVPDPNDPRKRVVMQNDPDINNLMSALYANTFKFDPVPLTETEQKYFDRLKEIPYVGLTLDEHVSYLYRFGKIIEELIPDPPKCKGGDEGDNKGEGGGHGGIGCPSCSPSLDGVPNSELDQALSEILVRKGPRAFGNALSYVKAKRPDYNDPFECTPEGHGKHAGLQHGEFRTHDELIPLYRRWAMAYGLYIAKRPVEKDKTTMYISQRKEFEPGDPIQKIDIFGSLGRVALPGITKIFLEEEGAIPAIDWEVPDLMVGIDSSGSMEHPGNIRGAPQVLAAFVLGKNYYGNGSSVGGWNFSTDIAFVNPSRDINAYYSMMAAYWGGGTVMNTERLKDFFARLEFQDDSRRKMETQFTDEKDYERMMSLVPEHEKKNMYDKRLEIDVSKLKQKVRRLDNVLITDGYIGNAQQVLEYLQTMGEITRNFVFLTDKSQYNAWKEIEGKIPSTFVYLAEKPEDLMRLALGRTRALVTDSYESKKKAV